MNNANSTPANPHATDTTGRGTRKRRLPWVIAGAVGAGLALAAVGAYAAGAFDDDVETWPPVGISGGAGDGPGGGTDDPSILIDAARAAQELADGVVVSVEVEGQRIIVEIESDGHETTVLVEDGEAEVVGTERDDDVAQINGLDAENITAAFEAAVAEVPGTVVELSADDDYEAYTVEVLTDSGIVEVDLDREFGVIGVDRD